jgi:hypothetical protein
MASESSRRCDSSFKEKTQSNGQNYPSMIIQPKLLVFDLSPFLNIDK